ncbi:bile acyl-CoA synthetase [Tachyglossus aculeatus]|uniref:bile acyl-CoA synthetase n=1 Tax=Tachyglossus aculeatus TaxID=9261 RepID=UPI0018F3FE77|nr:bile acyl-CoA synthetase [Tachyglossus aculeatus]
MRRSWLLLPAACLAVLLPWPLLFLLLLLLLAWLWSGLEVADLAIILALLRHGLHSHVRLSRRPPVTVLERFLGEARRNPQLPLLLCRGRVHTFGQLDRRSSQAARALMGAAGVEPGTCVAVLLPNGAPYVWVTLALAKLGCVVACLNWHVRGRALSHAVRTSEAKVVLADQEFSDALEEILPTLREEGVRVFFLSSSSSLPGVEPLLGHVDAASPEPISPAFRQGVTKDSAAFYIYTSGTTGLPKPAVLTHSKVLKTSGTLYLCGVSRTDVVYTALPLYHASALFVGLMGCIEMGIPCVLSPKFSASQFWDDCRRHRVTVIQYVGEVLRYLCATPQRDNDRDHPVRLAVGNGLRPEVWEQFLSRFGPVRVCEFYGSTEGNIGFINYTGKLGAVGKSSFLYRMLCPFELIQFDMEKEEPVRDSKGRCVPVGPGETGLLLTLVTTLNPFHGYKGSPTQTEQKLLRDVRRKGDVYFITGDLLTLDADGFLYFRDRIGDTFRWKGENVSTREVEATLASLDFLKEVNVYGVPVPGYEGKIGMMAVQLAPGRAFDGQRLYAHVRRTLSGFAAPNFVRVQEALKTTGTFKLVKAQLVREGFDPGTISEPLYVLSNKEKTFQSLTRDIYQAILDGKWRL